ncbi:dynamin family protein [Nocardioides marinquilinus]|uniref:Dynamin family protein n=1 Tax=Nocardioides marinquilinus TaxID=1210400 RepID=A0ABP9Q395_9ACTN
MTTSTPADRQMVTALVRLRQALVDAELPLALPGRPDLRSERAEVIDQLEDYLIPRLTALEAPLLAVVGGSTGAGKSTLVNSLVGHRVTTSGVLRPTTRSPVLVHHPDDAHWFGQDRLLPELTRVAHATDDPDSLQLVPTTAVPAGLAVLDAPDVDSVEERNRVLAGQLLAAADLWLFVTSAARYSDQVPWSYLRQAAERSAAVAIVLDRTPDEAIQTVSTHLARMLASRGLKDSPLFVVTEGKVDEEGLLAAHHVADVRGWLESLAADVDARTAVVRQTLDGAVRTITRRVHPVADAAAEQTAVVAGLREAVGRCYDEARSGVDDACADGTLVRGEVLARWREFVGSGELLRSLDTRVGGLRERLVNTIRGKPQQAERVTVAVEAALEALLRERAERAAEAVVAAWHDTEAGDDVLARPGGAELGRASRDVHRRAERTVRAWQTEVADLVRAEGAHVRTSANFLAYGVQGLTVALMVVVLAERAAGEQRESVDLGRRLLDAVFGEATVAAMVARSRTSLAARTAAVLDDERGRYLSLVGGLTWPADAAESLRTAARRVDDLRFQAARAAERAAGPAPTTVPGDPTT